MPALLNGTSGMVSYQHLEKFFMKSILAVASLSVAMGLFAASRVDTNVNSLVLTLEMPTTNLVAGERLKAIMVVSNASPVAVPLSWDMTLRVSDTGIGRFVVADDTGYILPRTIPAYYTVLSGIRPEMSEPVSPGKVSRSFDGDVVWFYSGLTNPGNYLVKAVGNLPLTNTFRPVITFEAETPWIAITVTPRPEDMPPAPHVYADYYAMIEQMTPEARAVFLKAQERAEAYRRQMEKPPVQQTPAKAIIPSPKVQPEPGARSQSDVPANEPPAKRTRNLYYASGIVLLLGATAVFLWRSRRSHS
jgi:hypothetical protein